MATFVVLANFTDKGIHDIKDTVGRADKFKDIAKSAGVTVKDMYWTLGGFDVVTICEAADDETAAALSMSISSRGHVKTQTLRAYSSAEMTNILKKLL